MAAGRKEATAGDAFDIEVSDIELNEGVAMGGKKLSPASHKRLILWIQAGGSCTPPS
jgi:hypothetical protein